MSVTHLEPENEMMTITELNPAAIRKAMAEYGIKPRRCRKNRYGLQVIVNACDVAKAKAWFRDFDIKRVSTCGVIEDAWENDGEFMALHAVVA